ncbi:hypothetical protein BU54_37910 [Escherichia coli O45:H2 str. 2010C-4211]|nr:hypothetical protein BU54_37910 [Escherichia coli O45:H2 str. 2010C-4211]
MNESLPLLAFLIRWYGVNMAGGLSSRCFVIQVQRYFFYREAFTRNFLLVSCLEAGFFTGINSGNHIL